MIFGDGEYDRDIDIAVNRREVWEDGREEGREEGLEFTARNALAKGISVKTVQEITGLPLDRINDLTAN